jgi:CDP-diacylglycerol--glycerol-3-phosphate 3-phosphatidyltransferase
MDSSNSKIIFSKIPNILTTIRIFVTPILIYFIYLKIYNVGVIIFALLIMLTDFFDGYIARKYNLISNYGKLMDPIADKIFVFGILSVFLIQDQILLLSYLIALFREFLVSAIRMLALEKNQVIAADKFGKIKTVLQFIFIFVTFIYIINGSEMVKYFKVTVEVLMTAFTLISLANYFIQYNKTTK